MLITQFFIYFLEIHVNRSMANRIQEASPRVSAEENGHTGQFILKESPIICSIHTDQMVVMKVINDNYSALCKQMKLASPFFSFGDQHALCALLFEK